MVFQNYSLNMGYVTDHLKNQDEIFYDNSIIEAKTAVNNCHVHINLHIFQNREITTMENKK